ncbi:MAG: TonB-dependent receptor [Chitinophagaceae bacterium]|nr:TonB-dependent receptor [Chitinophagaceae bacterium]
MTKFTFIVILSLITIDHFAQGTGAVNGRIVDTNNEPLASINVLLSGVKGGTFTNENGEFAIRNITPGLYTLEATGIGFSATKQNIQIVAGKTLNFSLQLDVASNTLQEVLVNAGIRKGYSATNTNNTKLPARLLDLPLSIKVVSRNLIDDRQAFEFKEIVKNVPGVNLSSGSNDIMIRGYQSQGGGASGSTQLINGSRNFFTGYTNDLNLTNIERIEILKGPSSVLFGATSPGGSINAITKKPMASDKYSAGASFGTWGRYRFDADLTGKLSEDKKLLYRFNAGYQNDPDYRDFIYRRNFIVAPTVRYIPSDKTIIDFEFVYNQINRTTWYDWGVPTWNGDVFAVPIEYTSHEPTDAVLLKNTMLMLQVQQKITSNLTFFSNFNGSSHRLDGEAHSPSFFNPIPGVTDSLVTRVYRQFAEDNQGTFLGNYVVWKPQAGKIKFNITGGLDYYKTRYYYNINQAGAFEGVPKINVFNPVYRKKSVVAYPPVGGFNDIAMINFRGVYLINLIELGDKFKVMLSGRWDSYTFKNYPSKSPNDTRPFLPSAGFSYQPLKGVSFYGGWTKGFLPQNTQSPDFGGPFDPEYSEQVEGGIKKEFLNGRYTATISYYDIKRKNVLVPKDPVNDPYGIKESTGKARSKGLEFDLAGNITPNWGINAGYAYNDSRITQSTYSFEIKRQASNAPFHTANLWTRYNVSSGKLKGLGFAAGFYHVGKRTTDGTLSFPSPDLQQLPDFTTIDGGLFYRHQNLLLNLNIENVFNEQFIYGAANAFYMQRGKPRNAMMRIQFLF